MVFQSIQQGSAQVGRTKRMVLFAWLVNVAVALLLALPLLDHLNAYIGTTVRETELRDRFDPNWYHSWQLDTQPNPITALVDYSILGYAPFLNHAEAVLNGVVIKEIGRLFYDLLFRWSITPPGLLTILTFSYVLLSSFLAGAFIGTYARDYRLSFSEFLMEGAKHFGRFFRLSLLSLVVYFLLFAWLFDWATDRIPAWTANEPSEMTPFVYYMVKNAVVFFLLAIVTLCVDYAKIRVVVEDRISALVALVAGARFAVVNFRKTFGLYLVLSVIGLLLIVLYAVVERQVPQQTNAGVITAFLLGQVYLLGRFWLKAMFYASQTSLYQSEQLS